MAKFSSSLSKVNSETILIIIVIVIAIIVVVYFLNKKQECFGIDINNLPQCTQQQSNDIYNSGGWDSVWEGIARQLGGEITGSASHGAAGCKLNDACQDYGIPFECVPLNSNSNQTTWNVIQ